MTLNETTNIFLERRERLAVRYTKFVILQLTLVFSSTLFAFLYFIIVIRQLPLLDVAILGKAVLVFNISRVFIHFGITYAVTQKVPPLIRKQEYDKAFSLTVYALKGGLILSLLTALVLTTIMGLLLEIPFFYLLLTIIYDMLFILFQYVLVAYNAWIEITKSSIMRNLRMFLYYTFIISFFLLMKNLIAIFYGWLVSVLIILPIAIYFHPLRKMKYRSTKETESLREIITFGFPQYINYLLITFGGYFDQLFMALFFTSEVFAIYFVLSRIVSNISSIMHATRTGIIPTLSYFTGDEERERKVFKLFLKFMMLLIAGPFIIAAIFSDVIIILLLSPEYLAGKIILSILFIAAFSRFINMILLSLVLSKGDIKALPWITSITLGIRILVVYLLSVFGSEGVALAKAIAELFGIILLYVKYRKLIAVEKSFLLKLALICLIFFPIYFFRTGLLVFDIFLAVVSWIIYIIGLGIIRVLNEEEVRYLLGTKNKLLVYVAKIFIKVGRF